MIDNPLENQTLENYDNLYINEKYEEHCTDTAKEIANELKKRSEVGGLPISYQVRTAVQEYLAKT